MEATYGTTDAKWTQIKQNLDATIPTLENQSKTQLRDQFDKLLASFRRADKKNIAESGTSEQYGEKEKLLTDLLMLKKNVELTVAEKKMLKANEDVSRETGKQLRDTGMQLLQEERAASSPPKKRTKMKLNVQSLQSEARDQPIAMLLQMRQEKDAAMLSLRERQIALEERRMKLDEAKWQYEMNKGMYVSHVPSSQFMSDYGSSVSADRNMFQ